MARASHEYQSGGTQAKKILTKGGEMKEGTQIVFTKDLSGVCEISKGDTVIYLGNSQARIETGKSKDWLVYLQCDAPYLVVHEPYLI